VFDIKRTAFEILFAKLTQPLGCRFVCMPHEFLYMLFIKGAIPSVMVGDILNNLEDMDFCIIFFSDRFNMG
jgi:hypothetical protein